MSALKAMDALQPADLRAEQERRLREVLDIARTLKGYARTGTGGRLETWPILTKQDILGHEDDFAIGTLYPSPHAETGGTTGQPLRMKRSVANIAFEQALIDWLCLKAGIDWRTARTAFLKGDTIKPALIAAGRYWADVGDKKRIYSSHHITAATIEVYRRSLIDYAPDILFCYPSSLESLSQHLGEHSGVRIPLVFSSSETLHPSTLSLARDRLSAQVLDYYGHSERIVSAYSFNGEPYRFIPAYGHAELIPCGEGLARIVATTVRPRDQIFIRYDTGDIARVGSDDPIILQAIGLGLRPFSGIDGRDNEFVELEDGRRIVGINQIARGAYGASSVQLHRIAPTAIDIYIVPAENFGPETGVCVLDNFYLKFPPAILAHLWLVNAPLREPNGKAPILLRRPVLPDTRTPLRLPARAD
ncbi:MAG: hypothetical protein AB7F96_04575 [Beijerinckiaceae bacterium]